MKNLNSYIIEKFKISKDIYLDGKECTIENIMISMKESVERIIEYKKLGKFLFNKPSVTIKENRLHIDFKKSIDHDKMSQITKIIKEDLLDEYDDYKDEFELQIVLGTTLSAELFKRNTSRITITVYKK